MLFLVKTIKSNDISTQKELQLQIYHFSRVFNDLWQISSIFTSLTMLLSLSSTFQDFKDPYKPCKQDSSIGIHLYENSLKFLLHISKNISLEKVNVI